MRFYKVDLTKLKSADFNHIKTSTLFCHIRSLSVHTIYLQPQTLPTVKNNYPILTIKYML